MGCTWFNLPCKVLKTFPASSVFWALTYTQPSMFSVSTAIWSIDAGGFVAEHLRSISSLTCHIHPVFDLLFWLFALGELELTCCGSNICLILRHDVGATVGAATFRFKLLNAAPCHEFFGVPAGGDTGVDVELGWEIWCCKNKFNYTLINIRLQPVAEIKFALL